MHYYQEEGFRIPSCAAPEAKRKTVSDLLTCRSVPVGPVSEERYPAEDRSPFHSRRGADEITRQDRHAISPLTGLPQGPFGERNTAEMSVFRTALRSGRYYWDWGINQKRRAMSLQEWDWRSFWRSPDLYAAGVTVRVVCHADRAALRTSLGVGIILALFLTDAPSTYAFIGL